jgi:hypothetical protein
VALTERIWTEFGTHRPQEPSPAPREPSWGKGKRSLVRGRDALDQRVRAGRAQGQFTVYLQVLAYLSSLDDPVGFDFTWDEKRFTGLLWPELAEFVPAFDTLKVVRG